MKELPQTIGQMLSQMESELDECRQIKAEIEKFRIIFDNSPDDKKREILKNFLEKHGINQNVVK